MSYKEAYGYAVARIRAMELRLLDASVFTRLLDADDTASVMKILGETSYAAALTSVSGDGGFDKVLETVLHDTYEEINSFAPQKELVALLRLPYDFSNAKVMLKSVFSVRSGGKKRWDLLTSLGSYPVDKLISDVETEDYQLLPFGLNTLFPKCLSVWEQSRDVLETERLLDKQMFTVMLEQAEKLAVPEVVDWVKIRIDGENIRSLVRLKRFGFDAGRAQSFLHDGGNIDLATLAQMLPEPFETWGRMIDYSDLAGLFSSIDAGASFADVTMNLERELDDFYLRTVLGSRYSSSAPCNVIAYLWAKELEVKNIRMIAVSKANAKDGGQIRRLLRNVGA